MSTRTSARAAMLLRAVAFMAVSVLLIAAAWMASRGVSDRAIVQLSVGVIATAGVLVTTFAFSQVEKTKPETVGVGWNRTSLVRFGAGFAAGLALVALTIMLSVLAFGPLSATRNQLVAGPSIAVYLLGYIGLAAMEELAFRGYPLFRLRSAYGVWVAQIIVAVAFAVYHIAQGWPLLAALLGTTAGSILFGAAALRTGGLAFPIGIHAAWNFGTWALGEKAAGGVWVTARRPGDDDPLIGSLIYLGVMLGAAWLVGRVGRRRAEKDYDFIS